MKRMIKVFLVLLMLSTCCLSYLVLGGAAVQTEGSVSITMFGKGDEVNHTDKGGVTVIRCGNNNENDCKIKKEFSDTK